MNNSEKPFGLERLDMSSLTCPMAERQCQSHMLTIFFSEQYQEVLYGKKW